MPCVNFNVIKTLLTEFTQYHVVAVLYSEMIDIGCFSYTIDHVDEHFKTPHHHEFGMYWMNLFSHSPKT